MTAALRVRALVHRFPHSQETVLDGLDFQVAVGEFVCILGPSGCGKTTLLRLIGGLLQPYAGSVEIAPAGTATAESDRPAVAFVFQNARLCGWRNVEQNISLGMELACPHISPKERRQRIDRYLAMVRLEERRHHYPGTLSGGEAQRAALARALAVEAPLLLMDEPFANLDLRTRHHLREALRNIWESTRRTVVFVTHDVEEAIVLGDRILLLSDRPARLLDELPIDTPRPRAVGGEEYLWIRNRIREAFAEQGVPFEAARL